MSFGDYAYEPSRILERCSDNAAKHGLCNIFTSPESWFASLQSTDTGVGFQSQKSSVLYPCSGFVKTFTHGASEEFVACLHWVVYMCKLRSMVIMVVCQQCSAAGCVAMCHDIWMGQSLCALECSCVHADILSQWCNHCVVTTFWHHGWDKMHRLRLPRTFMHERSALRPTMEMIFWNHY